MIYIAHGADPNIRIELSPVPGTVAQVETVDAIHSRKSTGRLWAPAPSDADLEKMLAAADRAPDHKQLKPWRFFILRGEQKDAFGAVLASALATREPPATDGQLEKERHKFDRAPLVIVAATKRLESPLPFEELLAATAAAIQNILLVATDLGYGSMWRTGDAAYDDSVKIALDLDTTDFISGFLYLGTTS